MKTYSQKPADVTRQWYILDASGATMGRIAAQAASLLLGKGKPTVTSHVDGGDYVVIVNAANVQISGNKVDNKVYYRHSGFPGGLYSKTLKQQIEQDAATALRKAVRGMMPDNKLRAARLERLKIYNGSEYNHAAQKPREISVKEPK